jgi:hypothetical protein
MFPSSLKLCVEFVPDVNDVDICFLYTDISSIFHDT